MRLRTILVPTDFGVSATAAWRYAKVLARRFNARLHVLHVISTPYLYDAWGTQSIAMQMVDLQAQLERDSRQELKRMAAQSGPLGRRITTSTVTGTTVDSVLTYIAAKHIDLVVMGTHGRRGLQKVLLGSVAEKVLRGASCPVLTVGPCVHLGAECAAEMKRILFATDFSAASEAATAYALSLAQENQAVLDVVHIVEPRNPGEVINSAELVSGYAARMRSLIPADSEFWCEANSLIEVGQPAEQILNVAKARRSQLIVLGVKAASNLTAAAHLPWAIAHKILSAAECPVFTVRG